MLLFSDLFFRSNLKYSIIIPTLNEEKLLPNLLNQIRDSNLKTEYNYEIILSDGGSTDKTVEIALNYVDTVTVHNCSHQQNIAGGRNNGAQEAKGDTLIFINGDVLLSNPFEFFEYLEKYFTNSNHLAMTCNVKVFPDEEKLSDKLFHSFYNKYFGLLNAFGLGMGRGECQIVRREIFEKVEGYNEKLAAGEDFDLFIRVRKLGSILFASNLCVYESPRRYRKLGYSGVTWSWFRNGLSVLFKNKSISKEWEQVR